MKEVTIAPWMIIKSVPSPGLVLRPPVRARPGCSLACAAVSMKNPGAAESRRLVVLLEAALLREARLWKVPVFKDGRIQVRHVHGQSPDISAVISALKCFSPFCCKESDV